MSRPTTIRPGLSRRSGGRWSVAVSALALVLGCARLEPTLPMRARSADVDLDLRLLRVGAASKELVYASRSVVPHTIGHVWLTVPTRVPCSGGHEAAALAVDDGLGAPGALAPGSHELRPRFEPNVDDVTLDLVVDFEIEEGGCLRAPAVSQSIPFVVPRRFVLTTSLDLDANEDLRGLRATTSFRVGGGGWVGPLLVTAVVGVGASTCNEGTCGRDKDNSLQAGLSLPAALDVRWSPGSLTRNRATLVGLLGARYSVETATVPAFDGQRRLLVHRLQGVAGWAVGTAVRGPVEHRERVPLVEMAFPIGVSWSPDAPANGMVLSGGLDMRFLTPL